MQNGAFADELIMEMPLFDVVGALEGCGREREREGGERVREGGRVSDRGREGEREENWWIHAN